MNERASSGRGRPRKRVLLLACAAGLLATLLLSETLIRLYVAARGWTANCYAPTSAMFVAHPEAGATIKPNFFKRSGTFTIATNAQGLRGPDRPFSKPEGTRRIALLGGSSVFGYLVSDGEEAARLLERQLRARGHAVEVINAGVPGYNLNQTRIRFRELVRRFDPDLVVLYLGWNDLPYVISDDPLRNRFLRRTPPSVRERLLGYSVLAQFLAYRLPLWEQTFAPPVSQEPVPTPEGKEAFQTNLERLAGEVRRSGAELVVCSQLLAADRDADPRVHDYLGADEQHVAETVRLGEWLRETLHTFAGEQGLTFVDVAAALPANPELLADAVHLTPAGERLLAQQWTAALVPLLEKADGRGCCRSSTLRPEFEEKRHHGRKAPGTRRKISERPVNAGLIEGCRSSRSGEGGFCSRC